MSCATALGISLFFTSRGMVASEVTIVFYGQTDTEAKGKASVADVICRQGSSAAMASYCHAAGPKRQMPGIRGRAPEVSRPDSIND